MPEALGAIGHNADRDIGRFDCEQGLNHRRPRLQLRVAGLEMLCQVPLQTDSLGCFGDKILVWTVGPGLVGDPEVLGAPTPSRFATSGDRIPQRPAIEQRSQEVEKYGVVAAGHCGHLSQIWLR